MVMTTLRDELINIGQSYRLVRARVPTDLVSDAGSFDNELIDIVVVDGTIKAIVPYGSDHLSEALPEIDLKGSLVLPCAADIHTHIDKAYTVDRAPNLTGTFMGAIEAESGDRQYWSCEDLQGRMRHSLQKAYQNGTAALRSHLVSDPTVEDKTWGLFADLRDEWQGRIELQGVCLIGDDALDDIKRVSALADRVARYGGVFGCAVLEGPVEQKIRRIDTAFEIASARGLDLDFHVDENGCADSRALQLIAERALREGFSGKIVAGHCCSLSHWPESDRKVAIESVAAAGITVVCMPLTNLYLQGRKKGETPFWRGLTLINELVAGGVDVAFASDNCQDPWNPYGDYDLIDVLRVGALAGHLDLEIEHWIRAITKVPAAAMLGDYRGTIYPGGGADLQLFGVQSINKLLATPSQARLILRDGAPI